MSAQCLERLLLFFSRNKYLRKATRVGGLVFALRDLQKGRQERIVKFLNYQLWVNIVESHGLMSYYFQSTEVPLCCEELVPEGGVFWDVGSNMGHWSIAMASRVGNKGKVVAFEPNPTNRSMIEKSVQLNHFENRCMLVDRPLWNKSEIEMEFHLSADPHNSGTSSLKKHELLDSSTHSIRINTLTGDDFFSQNNFSHIDLMKVDVERAEYEVLLGFDQTLRKGVIRAIHLETEMNSSAWQFLLDLGYCCKGRVLDNKIIDLKTLSQKTFGDYLFILGN